MSISPGSEEFARMLNETLQAVGKVSQAGGEEGAETTHVGEAAEGRVRATVTAGGRLESLYLDPRMMRLGSEELGEHVVTAVNAAFDALRAQALPTAGVDLTGLAEQVRELRDTAVPRMESFLQAMVAAQERLAGGGAR